MPFSFLQCLWSLKDFGKQFTLTRNKQDISDNQKSSMGWFNVAYEIYSDSCQNSYRGIVLI